MTHCFRGVWHKIKGKDKRSRTANAQPSLDSDQKKETYLTASKTTDAVHHSEQLSERNQKQADFRPKDLWEVAYKELGGRDRQILSGIQTTVQSARVNDHRNGDKPLKVVDEVIRLTEKQYEEYQKGGWKIKRGSDKDDINLRDVAKRVLNATLSFKDIVSAVVVFDPTGHASSAGQLYHLG